MNYSLIIQGVNMLKARESFEVIVCNFHPLKFPVKILTKKGTIEKLLFGWDTKKWKLKNQKR